MGLPCVRSGARWHCARRLLLVGGCGPRGRLRTAGINGVSSRTSSATLTSVASLCMMFLPTACQLSVYQAVDRCHSTSAMPSRAATSRLEAFCKYAFNFSTDHNWWVIYSHALHAFSVVERGIRESEYELRKNNTAQLGQMTHTSLFI